jgi:hypothetical protein
MSHRGWGAQNRKSPKQTEAYAQQSDAIEGASTGVGAGVGSVVANDDRWKGIENYRDQQTGGYASLRPSAIVVPAEQPGQRWQKNQSEKAIDSDGAGIGECVAAHTTLHSHQQALIKGAVRELVLGRGDEGYEAIFRYS